MNAPGLRFRELLARPQTIQIPGGFSPLMARMVEKLGFEAFFMAGSQTSGYVYGLADVGVISLTEMAQQAARVAAGCDIPVFADGDTGFGNAIGVYRSVQEYARAGVGAMSIEDQEAPKKSGTSAGRRCIPADEAVGKIRAAVAARDAVGSDMVIIARCDTIGSEGGTFEEAIVRCTRYVREGGADAIWINTVGTREEIREACARIPGPVIPLYGGPPPAPSIEEWQDLGASAVLYPALTTTVGLQALWEFLNDFKERDIVAQREWGQRARQGRWGAVTIEDFLQVNKQRTSEMEAEFLPTDLQRDYTHTWGHPTEA